MRIATTSLVIVTAIAVGGCKQFGILAKREHEKCCPTDIRQTVPWCAGEDALFHGPCKPDAHYYGYKPTCWGVWPTSGAEWRDTHCGGIHHGAIISDLTNRKPRVDRTALRRTELGTSSTQKERIAGTGKRSLRRRPAAEPQTA